MLTSCVRLKMFKKWWGALEQMEPSCVPGSASSVTLVEKKKCGVSCLFLHQWLILCHFIDVNESKIKFTNVSAALIEPCTKCGGAEVAFNDCPIHVEALHKYIKSPMKTMKRCCCEDLLLWLSWG